ncbi:hypothetical protein LCGC14_1172360 [marine sediment metagenome]|uniref:Uncharacterized protein n=1 Tax=marine sediment metagenome TaxID=412755 RepID=A0A0F9PUY9_9ZZZZ
MTEIIYDCPVCRDGGFLHPRKEDGKPDYSKLISCKCREAEILANRNARLLELCNLPFGTESWTLDNYETDKRWPSLAEAKQAAIDYAGNAGEAEWLILMGKRDTGKTHLAIGICRRWLIKGKAAKYILVPQMLDDLREGYSQDRRREASYRRDQEAGLSGDWGELPYEAQMRMLKDVDLLVLDDLGAQVPTPWAMEKIMMIIDHRYINGLPLVVTTNKPLNKLPGDAEGRIGSRLLRFQASKIITLASDEYRTWRRKEKRND